MNTGVNRAKTLAIVGAVFLCFNLNLFLVPSSAGGIRIDHVSNSFANDVTYSSDTLVEFDLSKGPIIAEFSTRCVPSSANIRLTPGSSETIRYSLSSGPGEIGIEVMEYSLSTGFGTPIESVSIPAFSAWVATAYVDISGSLDGDVNDTGVGAVSRHHLHWDDWGARSVTVSVPSHASPGETFEVNLDLVYAVDVGARVTALGVDVWSGESNPGGLGLQLSLKLELIIIQIMKLKSSAFVWTANEQVTFYV